MSEPVNVWYVCDAQANAKMAFTSNPEMAARDLTGAPIIAPGHLIKFQKDLVRRARAKIKEAEVDAWNDGYRAAMFDLRNDPQITPNPYAEKGTV